MFNLREENSGIAYVPPHFSSEWFLSKFFGEILDFDSATDHAATLHIMVKSVLSLRHMWLNHKYAKLLLAVVTSNVSTIMPGMIGFSLAPAYLRSNFEESE